MLNFFWGNKLGTCFWNFRDFEEFFGGLFGIPKRKNQGSLKLDFLSECAQGLPKFRPNMLNNGLLPYTELYRKNWFWHEKCTHFEGLYLCTGCKFFDNFCRFWRQMTSGMIMLQWIFILQNFYFCPSKAWNIENVKFGQNKWYLASFYSSRPVGHESVYRNPFFSQAKEFSL